MPLFFYSLLNFINMILTSAFKPDRFIPSVIVSVIFKLIYVDIYCWYVDNFFSVKSLKYLIKQRVFLFFHLLFFLIIFFRLCLDEPHLSASCGFFTFQRFNYPRGKIRSWTGVLHFFGMMGGVLVEQKKPAQPCRIMSRPSCCRRGGCVGCYGLLLLCVWSAADGLMMWPGLRSAGCCWLLLVS